MRYRVDVTVGEGIIKDLSLNGSSMDRECTRDWIFLSKHLRWSRPYGVHAVHLIEVPWGLGREMRSPYLHRQIGVQRWW